MKRGVSLRNENGYNAHMKKATKPKFVFEKLKSDATSPNPLIRKKTFIEYFERFNEFPSYLFDNSDRIDDLLLQTINDIEKDSSTSQAMMKGLAVLLERLPARMQS